MTSLVLSIASLFIQSYVIYVAVRLLIITRHRVAWGCISAGMLIILARRIFEVASYFDLNEFIPNSYYTLMSFAVSLCMAIGMHLAKRMIDRMMETNERLTVSEAYHRGLMDYGTEAIFTLTMDGRFTSANQRGLELLGYTLEQMKTLTTADVFDAEDVQRMPIRWDELRSGNLVITQRRIRKANGEFILADLHSRTLPDGTMMSSVRDITAHSLVMEQLRFQAHLLDTVQQSVFAVGPDGRLSYCNKFAVEMFGWQDRQVIGVLEAEALRDNLSPETLQQMMASVSSGQRWTGEIAYFDRAGNRSPAMLIQSPMYDHDARLVGSIGISFDLSELQEAEQAAARAENLLREFIDAAPFGAHHYELQPDGTLVFTGANATAERVLNFDHSPLIGKSVEQAFPSMAQSNIPEVYRSVALTGVPWESSQVRYSDGVLDGSYEVSAFQTGQHRMVALFKDVTDRVRAEEALRQREIRLQTINDIARGISTGEPLESIVERALLSIYQAYPQYRVAYGEIGESGLLHYMRSFQGTDRSGLTNQSIDLNATPVYLEQLRRGEIVAVSSPHTAKVSASTANQNVASFRAPAFLAVPVELHGTLRGIVGFDSVAPVSWTEYEMKLLLEVAGYLQIAYRDIEAREAQRNFAESLRQSEERFRQALRNAPVVMFHQDNELRYTWNYNPGDERVTTYQVGKTDHELFPTELANRLTKIKREVMASRIGQRFEAELDLLGRPTCWDCTVEPLLNRRGEVIGIAGVSTDITVRRQMETELRNSEARFKTLADNLPAYVWITDADGGVTYFNRQTIEALGGDFETLKGLQWLARIHPDDRPSFDQLLANSYAARLPFECTIRVRRSDGEYRSIHNNGVPQFGADGTLVGYVGSCFDITSRLESESHYRDLVATLRMALQVIQSGTFEYYIAEGKLIWSEEMQRIYGIPVGTFTGEFREWTDRLIPEEVQETLDMLALDISTGGGARNEFRIRRLEDGEVRWIEARGEVQYDVAGNPVRMIGVNTDITERKRAEAELRHAEYLASRMRSAFLELNKCQSFGETLEPLLRAAFDLSSLSAGGIYLVKGNQAELVHDVGLPGDFRSLVVSVPLDAPHVQLVVRSEKAVYLPVELPTIKEACERCGVKHIYSFPLKSGRGEVFGFLNLASFRSEPPREADILALDTLVSEAGIIFHRLRTELALEEAAIRRRVLVDQSRDGISTIDQTGRVVEANQRFADMLGYSMDEMRRLHVWDWDSRFSRAEILRNLDSLSAEGMQFETLHRRKDGTMYAAELSINVVEFGQERLFFSVCRDISERKSAEAERVHLEGQLRLAQKLETIGTMAAGIAHDFNNLLVPIIGYTELVASDAGSGRFSGEYLQEVLKAAYRAKGLVAHILAFSRQQTGERKPVHIESIVAEVIAELSGVHDGQVQVRYSTPGGTPPVLVDPNQMHQIVANLCENAVDALEKGGELTVETALFDFSPLVCPNCKRRLHGKMVHVRVTDTGCGMNEETLKRMFDPFFTTKGVGKGTGLGLAVTHGIVTQHNGHICAESVLGQGTTFHLFLPVASPAVATVETLPVAAEGGSESILIIDDEPSVANSHAASLSSLGYRVTVAFDPQTGLTLFREHPAAFDCVLLDQRMPNMTGDQVAVELLQARPDIPVVICSGFSDSLNLKAAQDLGIRDILMKPVIAGELSRALRRAMAKTNVTYQT